MKIIQSLLSALSPELKKAIVKSVNDLADKANKTSDPNDDIAISILKDLLGIKD